jgi:hypothetical protein
MCCGGCRSQDRQHALANARPGSFPSVGVGIPLEPPLERRVTKNAQRGHGQVIRAAEGHHQPALVGQSFHSVRIRRRDDRFAGAQSVGERATGDLLRVEIGRDVDVAGEQIVDDLGLGEVLVDEVDVMFEAALFDQLPELIAV